MFVQTFFIFMKILPVNSESCWLFIFVIFCYLFFLSFLFCGVIFVIFCYFLSFVCLLFVKLFFCYLLSYFLLFSCYFFVVFLSFSTF